MFEKVLNEPVKYYVNGYFNVIVPNAPFFYPLKTYENRKVF